MSRTRALLLSATLSGLALLAAKGWISYGLGARQERAATWQQGLLKRVETLNTGDLDAEEALKRLASARDAYRKRLERLEKTLIRADGKYLPDGKDDPENHFKQLLVGMRDKCRSEAGMLFDDQGQLGFTDEAQKEPVRLRLLRLAAMERLLATLRQAGIGRVMKVEHLAPRPLARLEGLYNGVVALPITVHFACAERETAAFLQALSSVGTSAALEALRLEVTAQYKGVSSQVTVSYIFTDAADLLPEKPESGRLAGGRRRW